MRDKAIEERRHALKADAEAARIQREQMTSTADTSKSSKKKFNPSFSDSRIITAKGTRRICALPNMEYFSTLYKGQRDYRRKNAYDEYVNICEINGELPYAYSTFCSNFSAWRRQFVEANIEDWYAGEYLRTYISTLDLEDTSVHLFVAQLVFSDLTYVVRVEQKSLRCWCKSCENAYRYFGGVPRVTERPSTMFSGSDDTQTSLTAFAYHFQTVLYKARPKTAQSAEHSIKPLDSGKGSFVTSAIRKRIKDGYFETDKDLDRAIRDWVDIFNNLASKKQPSRRDIFEQQEKNQLLPLPNTSFTFEEWGLRTVLMNHHFRYKGVLYSVPYQYAGLEIKMCADGNKISAYFFGEKIAEHKLAKNPKGRAIVTNNAHRPKSHHRYAYRLDIFFVTRAKEHGPCTARAMKAILTQCKQEKNGYLKCKEFLDLSKKPANKTLEDACEELFKSKKEVTIANIDAIMHSRKAST